ncbi:DNA repair protein RecN [Corynebacterium belfantii]|uniref:DNA repair protein RecN n=1 Tax=Corynebacterium belfantii TaxID=2014537 RepID=UPI000967BD43|nr:DNA repair protein RecN [Corynebacterium belfantii]OLN15141.1 DNA repair protein RecN [Corynebacterium diphtheriae subsp. lausannense]MBG9244697.1 DNA repair protein RecN [Corynebacterium belfantii]MBG9259584.1 DNA repair protein RecN [Corynebacterium belfantii]MBG9266375.1 DNA repair protein RecN [Corynebacterium belfantii]MBG9287690.1 DNA repair protein RecN [Corynebacterium belfantii]
MLSDITIHNLGVIPSASLELSEGLTVLTGETGAGKTMVVTGLRLLAGGRAEAQRVRSGSSQAVVEGRFLLDSVAPESAEMAHAVVSAAGGALDENGEVIVSRTVSAQGRSRAHLGGRSVPAANLAEFSKEVLTIHGQNDQLRLLNSDRQRDALDRFSQKIGALTTVYSEAYRAWKNLSKDLRERQASKRELAQEVDRLEFAIREISEVDPQPDEEANLLVQITRLQDVDDLRAQAVGALSVIDGAAGVEGYATGDSSDVNAASDLIGQALSSVRVSSDPILQGVSQQLEAVTSILMEVSAQLGGFLDELPADPKMLDELLQRQQALKQLTRKYASDIDGVIKWKLKAEQKLESIDVSPEALDQLKKETALAERKMNDAGMALRAARIEAAQELSNAVTKELHGLAMPKAMFSVVVHPTEPQPSGFDEVKFCLAPNKATDPRPLASSASGGELSRVMLALEVILSAEQHGNTLVFDEVDAGVGGRAAVEIGRRLARLAQNNQVIVVTHLPQVAAYADTHLHLAKDVGESTVTSGVENLSEQRRVEELARMLAGLEDTDTGRAHARELFEKAQEENRAFRVQR